MNAAAVAKQHLRHRIQAFHAFEWVSAIIGFNVRRMVTIRLCSGEDRVERGRSVQLGSDYLDSPGVRAAMRGVATHPTRAGCQERAKTRARSGVSGHSLRGRDTGGIRLPRINPAIDEHLIDGSLQTEESPPHWRSRLSAMTDFAHPISRTWQSRFSSWSSGGPVPDA
ncbi:hypothetical protein ebA5600 [Aromatoleum aromaticum EbN1]|uniref:Uncharacterized protein n=1 Tax=Aromatoleum aromaticum (strain DSM 19018 / LMG 30748 / EbN1) TaxID=76114 RepID=Q5P052_AROAE|nr:hypothetical protein ebA5600 [Aromatoleum aromaticum EbN1]